jgi:hypothetical protein
MDLRYDNTTPNFFSKSDKIVLIKLSYNYFYNFNKKKNSKWIPSIGIGATPYFSHMAFNITTNQSNIFPQKYTDIGAELFVTPRISYMFSKRFFVEFSVPLSLGIVNIKNKKNENASLTREQQNINHFDFKRRGIFNEIKIGIGVKL